MYLFTCENGYKPRYAIQYSGPVLNKKLLKGASLVCVLVNINTKKKIRTVDNEGTRAWYFLFLIHAKLVLILICNPLVYHFVSTLSHRIYIQHSGTARCTSSDLISVETKQISRIRVQKHEEQQQQHQNDSEKEKCIFAHARLLSTI